MTAYNIVQVLEVAERPPGTDSAGLLGEEWLGDFRYFLREVPVLGSFLRAYFQGVAFETRETVKEMADEKFLDWIAQTCDILAQSDITKIAGERNADNSKSSNLGGC